MRQHRSVVVLLTLLVLGGCGNSLDWWLTPNQQGQYFYKHGDYSKSARSFEDPLWKGLAFYAAEEFASASAMLATIDTPYARFYLGNSFAQRDMLAEAYAAYLQALDMQPEFPAASFNRDWVKGLLDLENREYDDAGGTGGKLGADGFVFDDRADNATSTMNEMEAASQGLSDAQIEEVWMRRVQTTPGEFLAYKFAYQVQDKETDSGNE